MEQRECLIWQSNKTSPHEQFNLAVKPPYVKEYMQTINPCVCILFFGKVVK